MFLCAVVGLFYGNMLTPVKLMTEAGAVTLRGYLNDISDLIAPGYPYPTDAKVGFYIF